jgi:hypothetical protein
MLIDGVRLAHGEGWPVLPELLPRLLERTFILYLRN